MSSRTRSFQYEAVAVFSNVGPGTVLRTRFVLHIPLLDSCLKTDHRLAGWFVFRHHEYLPSAISRYRKEIRRVIGVLDIALANKEYLVGNKCTIADLAFVTWDEAVADMCEGELFMKTLYEDCPNWTSWRKRLLARPAVQRALQAKAKALQEAGPSIIPKNWEHEKKEDNAAYDLKT